MNLFENLQLMKESSISEQQVATKSEIKEVILSYLENIYNKYNKPSITNSEYEVYANATQYIGDKLLDDLQIYVERKLNVVNIEHVISENEFYNLVEEIANDILIYWMVKENESI